MPVIDHIAILTRNLERLKDYYMGYFGGTAGEKYTNPVSGMQSYFISFERGARLELITLPGILAEHSEHPEKLRAGYAHLAFGMESEGAVNEKARLLALGGYKIVRGPRRTGDGYYEFETLDPDNNLVEVTCPVSQQPQGNGLQNDGHQLSE